jgi:hypothetical protein
MSLSPRKGTITQEPLGPNHIVWNYRTISNPGQYQFQYFLSFIGDVPEKDRTRLLRELDVTGGSKKVLRRADENCVLYVVNSNDAPQFVPWFSLQTRAVRDNTPLSTLLLD